MQFDRQTSQALCLEFARKHFPGYQALVVTHTDGHSGSGNIHTHIVINSLHKETVSREDYMDQPNDHVAGYKHRQTKKLLRHLQKNLMEICDKEGLHQVLTKEISICLLLLSLISIHLSVPDE